MTDTIAQPLETLNPSDISKIIDHTLLDFKADNGSEEEQIQQLCSQALQNPNYPLGFVCVRPRHIALAKQFLAGNSTKVATVIGFPPQKIHLTDEQKQPTVGNIPLDTKMHEIEQALSTDVDEFDVVMNIKQFKEESLKSDNRFADTAAELKALVKKAAGQPVKVIIETSLLDDQQIQAASRLVAQANASMVKTNTGMITGDESIHKLGATTHDIHLIKEVLEELGVYGQVGIKASSKIRNASQVAHLLAAGANRIGTSAGHEILHELIQARL